MLDLATLKARAADRLANPATLANAANPANPANQQDAPISQLAALAGLAASDAWCWPHAEAMNGAELQTFAARVQLFIRRGADESVAENLADRLVIRDRQRDHRRTCLECQHYRHGRCGNRLRAGLHSAEIGPDLAVLLQHCGGFTS